MVFCHRKEGLTTTFHNLTDKVLFIFFMGETGHICGNVPRPRLGATSATMRAARIEGGWQNPCQPLLATKKVL